MPRVVSCDSFLTRCIRYLGVWKKICADRRVSTVRVNFDVSCLFVVSNDRAVLMFLCAVSWGSFFAVYKKSIGTLYRVAVLKNFSFAEISRDLLKRQLFAGFLLREISHQNVLCLEDLLIDPVSFQRWVTRRNRGEFVCALLEQEQLDFAPLDTWRANREILSPRFLNNTAMLVGLGFTMRKLASIITDFRYIRACMQI